MDDWNGFIDGRMDVCLEWIDRWMDGCLEWINRWKGDWNGLID